MKTQVKREMEKRVEMYRRLLIWNIVFLLGLLCWESAHGQYKWQKTYGGASSESTRELIKIPLGYMLGATSSSNIGIQKSDSSRNNSSDYWVLKLNKNGDKIWDKTFGSGEADYMKHIINTSDNGFLICGESRGDSGFDKNDTLFGEKDYWIVKIDSNGNKLWDKSFGSRFDESLGGAAESKNAYFFSGMSTNSDSSGNKTDKGKGYADIWIIKTDKHGNKLWDKTLGGDYNEEGFGGIHKVNENRFLICGSSFSNSSFDKSQNPYGSTGNTPTNRSDFWVVYIDSNGNKISDKIYGSTGNEQLRASYYRNGRIVLFGITSGAIANVDFDMTGPRVNTTGFDYWVIVIDTNGNKLWDKILTTGALITGSDVNNAYIDEKNNIMLSMITGANVSKDKSEMGRGQNDAWIIYLDSIGNKIWDKTLGTVNNDISVNCVRTDSSTSLISLSVSPIAPSMDKSISSMFTNDLWLVELKDPTNKITGKVYPDFNSNCKIDSPFEYSVTNRIIYNSIENTYAFSNDNNYEMYNYGSDSAILKVLNLDSPLFVSCGRDSIKVKFNGLVFKDTSGLNFPVRSTKSGTCPTITSHSSSILRAGRWGTFTVCYQNNAMDTAFNAYIEVKVDLGDIDSISSSSSFTQTGNKLVFQLGHIAPFKMGCITYQVKIKTNKKIGTKHCHKSRIFPDCNLKKHHPKEDSSHIECSIRCLSNDTVELTLANIGLNDQKEWGLVKSYEDIIIFKIDSFKLNKGNNKIWKYKIDTNKVYTAEIHNNNYHHIYPNLIIHDDECSNKNPILFSNPIINFSRHDEAKEYEEACTIVRGSYDPNIKSVQPVGMFAEHYTSTGTELKYRIDFQNTGTDTAFRVVLVDTLSSFLDIASFVPGVSSHPYFVEFGGRAVKFIFDPISLIDSGTNEPASHGYVHFKIKHIAGINPKTKIENMADIYFDYNAPVRTNTVFNTIFDTIQIYVPKASDTAKGKDSTSSIQGVNQTSILVFPIPTTDKFFIQMSEPIKDLSIEIYDNQGRMIKTVSSSNNQTIEVSALGMTKGIYHIRCMSGEKLIVVKKIMVE